jgi:hypothetical protein
MKAKNFGTMKSFSVVAKLISDILEVDFEPEIYDRAIEGFIK